MLLNQLKTYLKQHKVATLGQLSHHLQIDPEFTRRLVATWIAKGKVRPLEKIPGCGSRCNKCLPEQTETYQWVE